MEGSQGFDAVEGAGYAVLSFAEPTDEGDGPIQTFIDEVGALDNLRGRLDP